MVNVSINFSAGCPCAVLLDSLVLPSSILSVWLLSSTTISHWSFCYFKILKRSAHYIIYENLRKDGFLNRGIIEIMNGISVLFEFYFFHENFAIFSIIIIWYIELMSILLFNRTIEDNTFLFVSSFSLLTHRNVTAFVCLF